MAGFAMDPPPAGEAAPLFAPLRRARSDRARAGLLGGEGHLSAWRRSAPSDTDAGRGELGGHAGRSCEIGEAAMRRAREEARARQGFLQVESTLKETAMGSGMVLFVLPFFLLNGPEHLTAPSFRCPRSGAHDAGFPHVP